MLKTEKKIKIFVIFLIFLIIYYCDIIILNSGVENLEDIITLIKKFLDPKNAPILNENEKLITAFWKTEIYCPFSKLTSHGLTKEEALLIIDFFKIESIEDLDRIAKFLREYIKK